MLSFFGTYPAMLLQDLLDSAGVSLTTAIVIAVIALCSLYLVYLIGPTIYDVIYNLYFHPLRKFPGPTSRAAFVWPDAWSKLKGKGYKDTRLLHDQYGSVVRILPNALSFSTAQAWKDIYTLKSDRTELSKDPEFYTGDVNIANANKSDHVRIRKLLAHGFSDGALLEQEPLLTVYFDLLISKLKKKVDARDRVDLMSYYIFTTFDIIGDLVLGEPFGALETGEYHPWISDMFASIKFTGLIRFGHNYSPVWLLIKLWKKAIPSGAKRAAHIDFVKTKAKERLDRETDRKDLTAYILRHNDKSGMTREEIISTSRVLLVAGSETTATLLSGATYFLLQNPAILSRVQAEVRTAFQSADDITLRSVSTPGRLPYLEAVLQESLRCYPPVPALLPRVTGREGAIIDGNYVAANVSVGVHQWSAYRSTANFASPDTFAPERWLPDPPAKYRDDKHAVLQPFSLGPRGCIGRGLAYFELRSILCRVLWHFDLHLDEESQGWIDQKEYTLWDKSPLWIWLKHRTDA